MLRSCVRVAHSSVALNQLQTEQGRMRLPQGGGALYILIDQHDIA
jgi:hypothetical protein